jgi:hypothetical protein
LKLEAIDMQAMKKSPLFKAIARFCNGSETPSTFNVSLAPLPWRDHVMCGVISFSPKLKPSGRVSNIHVHIDVHPADANTDLSLFPNIGKIFGDDGCFICIPFQPRSESSKNTTIATTVLPEKPPVSEPDVELFPTSCCFTNYDKESLFQTNAIEDFIENVLN